MLHDIFARVGVAHLETDARRRNDFTCFGVLFNDFNDCLIGRVVDEKTVYLSVLADEDGKRRKKLFAVPALNLPYGIFAVGQVFGFSKTVFVAYKEIPLGFLGIFIAACRFQIHFKLCADLRRFNFGSAVVAVLDDGDLAFDNILIGIERLGNVVFHGIQLGFCANVQAFGIEEVSLRRADFFQRPVIAADIILGGKLTVCVGGVGVDELIALIDAVLCACKRCVALRQALFAVTLGYGDIEFLEDIVKGLVRYLVPLDCGGLLFGYDIASRSVDFFEGISRADKHILESCNAVFIGHSILVDLNAGKRCSVEAEFHALGQPVLGSLFDCEVAAAELVAEIDGRHLTADYGYTANLLRNIFVIFGFGHGVNSGLEVVYLNHAAVYGFNGLVDAVALNAEGNTVHLAVLADLDDFGTAVRNFQTDISLDRVINLLTESDSVLISAARLICTVRPNNKPTAL